MAGKTSKNIQIQQYREYKRIANKKAISDLDILSPKNYASKYFSYLKKRSSAEGKVRRLKSGRDLVEGTHITQKPKFKKKDVFRYNKKYKSYISNPNAQDFQFLEIENDLENVSNVILRSVNVLESIFDRIPKGAKNYKFTKLYFSVDYKISFLDKSSGVWFDDYGTFQESYAIILKQQIQTALVDITNFDPNNLGALQLFFKHTDSIDFLIYSPAHFYLKAIKK